MSTQQSVTVLETPSPEAAQARADADAAAMQAAQGVTITDNNRDAGGNQVSTVVQQGQPQETLILGKFKSQDDLIAAYKALEQKLGQQGQQQQQDQQQQQEPAQQQQQRPQGEAPAQAIEAAAAEYAEKGQLSEDTFKALEQAGIPRQLAETYVAGVKAQEQLIEQNAYSITGGEQGYSAMVQWAASALSNDEIEAFDNAVTRGTPAQMKNAIEGLWARYRAANGFEPGANVTGANNAGSGDYFKSTHELRAAMSDPRYRAGDPAFHAEVQEKLARSLANGVKLFG